MKPKGMPGRYKRYPAYKDSGVDWLGKIPVDWEATRLKRVCRFAYGDSLALDDRSDGAVSVFGSNGVVGTHSASTSTCALIATPRSSSSVASPRRSSSSPRFGGASGRIYRTTRV